MATTPRDTVILTTPQGHEVMAELDYEHYEVRRAKVIHSYTGVIRPLDPETTETLERALKARRVYEHAIQESEGVQETLKRFGDAAVALGDSHPALAPYFREAEQHKTIARDMRDRARHFHDYAMKAIDKLAES